MFYVCIFFVIIYYIMSSIVNYNNDSKLRYNRIYNTKATMLNDYTRNAIYRRTGCLDKFGFSCVGNNAVSCPTPYKSVNYIDASNQNDTSLPCNTVNFYSDEITPPPVFMDKFYNKLDPGTTAYDINVANLDIKNMTKTNYYNAVTTEQDRTNTSELVNGLKGPIEFILLSKADPEQTVHYWTTNNWGTTNEFVDKQKQGEHVYITLRVHQADYSSGRVTVQAYSQRNGLQRSAITKHTFEITGYDSVFMKPENNTTTPYYIEYLTNWFDVNPANSFKLYPQMVLDKLLSPKFQLTDTDQEILANYITWLNGYSYNGPTSQNRDKLAVGFNESGVNIDKAYTYTYGNTTINPILTGATLDQFLSSGTQGWLQGSFKYTADASIAGEGGPGANNKSFTYETIYAPNKVDFRMNGDDIEFKTSGSFMFKSLIAFTNMNMMEILDNQNGFSAYPGFSITGYNYGTSETYADNAQGSIVVTSDFSTGVQADGWRKLININATTNAVTYHYMTKVYKVTGTEQGETDVTDIVYDLETERSTDRITATYLATSNYTGTWFKDIPTNAMIREAGVYGYNYKTKYTLANGNTITSAVFPSGQQVVKAVEIFDDSTTSQLTWSVVAYAIPETRFVVRVDEYRAGGTPVSTSAYGIRGLRIGKFSRLDGDTVPGQEQPWDLTRNYYGIGYSSRIPNVNPPQGLSSQSEIYQLPGLKSGADLIGAKLIRVLTHSNPNQSVSIEYTVHGTFNNSETDLENLYISFATVRPTTTNDPEIETNLFLYENKSAGIWVDSLELEKYGYDVRKEKTYLMFPREYVSTNTSSDLKNFNYHPDGKSVILSTGGGNLLNFYATTLNTNGSPVEKGEIITTEYMKYPGNTDLLGAGLRNRSTIANAGGGSY